MVDEVDSETVTSHDLHHLRSRNGEVRRNKNYFKTKKDLFLLIDDKTNLKFRYNPRYKKHPKKKRIIRNGMKKALQIIDLQDFLFCCRPTRLVRPNGFTRVFLISPAK